MENTKSMIFRTTSLNNEDLNEIIELLKETSGFIFPTKIADQSGFLNEDIVNTLTVLNIHNYLKHYVVPKYNNKIYTEYAEEGFSFNQQEEFINNINVQSNEKIELISVYKKHKFD
jgi:nitrate reductase beta subunit